MLHCDIWVVAIVILKNALLELVVYFENCFVTICCWVQKYSSNRLILILIMCEASCRFLASASIEHTSRHSRLLRHQIGKETDFHVSDLTPLFEFCSDKKEFFIQKIWDHRGKIRKRYDLKSLMKWLLCDEYDDTQEPCSALRNSISLHSYFRDKISLIKPR